MNQFPHQVAVLGNSGNEVKCSGTIVDEFTVLCAANCVDNRNRTSRDIVSILAGTNSIVLGGVRRNVFIAFIEKDEKFLKDIAMLRLEKPLRFNNESIKPTEIATKAVPVGAEVIIVGWALKPSASGEILGRLKYFKVKAIAKEKCGHEKNATIVCLGDLEGEDQVVNATNVCKGYFRASAFHQNKLIGFAIPKLTPTCILPSLISPSANAMNDAITQFERDFGF